MRLQSIDIETPEKIIFTYTIAEMGPRIIACFIDTVIQWSIIIITFIIAFIAMNFTLDSSLSGFQLAFAIILVFILQWGYFIFWEVITNGQSPGKIACRIRVIRKNGEPLDFGSIVMRNLVRIIDCIPFIYLVAIVAASIDRFSRRLGDIVSDTIVVHDTYKAIKAPLFTTSLSQATVFIPAYDTNLSEEDLYVIRRYLNSRAQLLPEKRLQIETKLANEVKNRLKIDIQIENPVDFLSQIYREHTHEDKQ